MLTKKILFLWLVGISVMVFWFAGNYPLPLGYDHGAYKHFTLLLGETDITKMPIYLQSQFEPFSGTFFYTLQTFLGKNFLFTFGYLGVFVATSLAFFILGKKKNMYTTGSYLGLFLFFFSIIQYSNFWWSFGKEMFAVFFLILLMRYRRNTAIMILLGAACIALHRLTGFVGILYLSLAYYFDHKKNYNALLVLLTCVIIGGGTYASTYGYQIRPLIVSIIGHFGQNMWIAGQSGTGFSSGQFWFYQVPIILMTLLGLVTYIGHNTYRKILKSPPAITLMIIGFLIAMKCFAYTRLGSFFDLFLIAMIARTFASSLQKKWIYIFLLVHICTWGSLAYQWHRPFVDHEEHEIIRTVMRELPPDATLVTLTGAYMSWMTEHTDAQIYSLYQGVSADIWSGDEKRTMQHDKVLLCKNLAKIPGEIFVYRGSREIFISSIDNPCLEILHKWSNDALLLHYIPER